MRSATRWRSGVGLILSGLAAGLAVPGVGGDSWGWVGGTVAFRRVVAAVPSASVPGSSVESIDPTDSDLTDLVPPADHLPWSEADPFARFAWMGSGSCSAQACHGGVDNTNGASLGAIGAEHRTWVRLDPHARAHASLLTERSKGILKRYRQLPEEVAPRPERDRECLNCHVAQHIDTARVSPGFRFTEGVGCEACHGPSEAWAAPHVADWWKTLAPTEKARYGMRSMDTIADRAESCLACHVGRPGMDVNHDLIAAGHPRLRFEFASYHAIYPKHWDHGGERRSQPDWEAKAWLVGQTVTAGAAIRLLEARASNAHERPWPELSEYDCQSCHRDLSQTPIRGTARRPDRKTSSLPWDSWNALLPDDDANRARSGLTIFSWGTWNLPLLPDLVQVVGRRDLVEPLAPLAIEMSRLDPNPNRVADLAAQGQPALDSLTRMLHDRTWTVSELVRVVSALRRKSLERDLTGHDRVAQLVLGLSALVQGLDDQGAAVRRPEVIEGLRGLAEALRFPPGSDTPNGPDPQAVRSALERLAPLETLTEPNRPRR